MSEDLMQRLDNLWAMLEEEGYYTKANTVTLAKDYISSLEWFREKVVWGFYEDGEPTYHQGKAGEHEICSPVTAEEVTGLLNKLKETESRLSKAMLIIERYGENEGYIPESVAHLYEELMESKNE